MALSRSIYQLQPIPWWSGTNSTFGFNGPTYSIQQAFRYQSENVVDTQTNQWPAYIFDNGCTRPDGSQNCTATCTDESAIFSSLDSLHNCLNYPELADQWANNSLPANVTKYLEDASYVSSPRGSALSDNITSLIKACLVDSCNDMDGCQVALKEIVFDSSPANINSTVYYPGVYGSYPYSPFDFCSYQTISVNPDIGGIGVYVSYWIQMGLAILASIALIWCKWVYYYLSFTLHIRKGLREARRRAMKARSQCRTRYLPSLTTAMTDFQKAQCFFMMAINIAAQVNRFRGGFQPSSLQQLYSTYSLVRSISISGYLPITFTLFTLHMVDMVSGYLVVLSVCTVAISIATFFTLGNFQPSESDLNYLSQQARSNGPTSCGGNNIFVYCYDPRHRHGKDAVNNTSVIYSMLGFCLIVLVLLIAHKCNMIIDPTTKQAKPWLRKPWRFVVRDFTRSLRCFQFVLGVLSLLFAIFGQWFEFYMIKRSSTFLLFSSICTLLFLIHLFVASMFGHRHTDDPYGRFSSKWLVFTFDWLIGIFWFAGIFNTVSLACEVRPVFSGEIYSICGFVFPNLLLGAFIWFTFATTTLLSTAQIIRTKADPPSKKSREYQYWLLHRFNTYRLQRRISKFMSPNHSLTSKMTTKPPTMTNRFFTKLLSRSETIVNKIVARTDQPLIKDYPEKMTMIAVGALYIVFWSTYIGWFAFFCLDLSWFAQNGVDKHTWSFGQVVAITVWAQPLCEYIHLEFRGMTRGFEHRLIWPYIVIRQDSNKSSKASSISDVESGIASASSSKDEDENRLEKPSPAASIHDVARDSSQTHSLTHSRVVSVDELARDRVGKSPHTDVIYMSDFADEARTPLRGVVSEYRGATGEGERQGSEEGEKVWQAPDAALVK